jgi:hypothetical protein
MHRRLPSDPSQQPAVAYACPEEARLLLQVSRLPLLPFIGFWQAGSRGGALEVSVTLSTRRDEDWLLRSCSIPFAVRHV